MPAVAAASTAVVGRCERIVLDLGGMSGEQDHRSKVLHDAQRPQHAGGGIGALLQAHPVGDVSGRALQSPHVQLAAVAGQGTCARPAPGPRCGRLQQRIGTGQHPKALGDSERGGRACCGRHHGAAQCGGGSDLTRRDLIVLSDRVGRLQQHWALRTH